MDDEAKQKLDFWSRHGKSVIAAVLVVAGLAYVLQQINPETMALFREQEARKATTTNIYRCLNNMAHDPNKTKFDMLGCAK